MEDNFMKNNFCKMHGFVLKLSAVARVGAKNRSFFEDNEENKWIFCITDSHEWFANYVSLFFSMNLRTKDQKVHFERLDNLNFKQYEKQYDYWFHVKMICKIRSGKFRFVRTFYRSEERNRRITRSQLIVTIPLERHWTWKIGNLKQVSSPRRFASKQWRVCQKIQMNFTTPRIAKNCVRTFSRSFWKEKEKKDLRQREGALWNNKGWKGMKLDGAKS